MRTQPVHLSLVTCNQVYNPELTLFCQVIINHRWKVMIKIMRILKMKLYIMQASIQHFSFFSGNNVHSKTDVGYFAVPSSHLSDNCFFGTGVLGYR